jgi:hypothetical protein
VTGGPDSGVLRRYLDRLRLALWFAAALPALARAAAVAAVAAALNALVIERLAVPPWPAFALALLGTAGFIAALGRLALALAPASLPAAARLAQAAVPALRNDVESSLELAPLLAGDAPGAVSRALVAALVAGTGERLAAIAPRRLVPWRPTGAAALLLAAALVPLAGLAATGGIPGPALRAVVDPRVYWPLGQVRFAVEPGDARIARGSDLVVRVRAAGARGGAVLIGFSGAPGQGVASMQRGPDGAWSWRFAAVAGDFSYRALAGAAASPWYRVRVADVPAAGNFAMRLTYPAYSGLPARDVAGGGEIEALRGTSVALAFSTSVPVAKAALLLGGNRVVVRPAGEQRFAATLYLNGEPSYRLELEDAAGLGNGGGPEYPVRYLPDAAPVVELLEPAGEVEADPRGTVVVRYRAADDYGLSALALVARAGAVERRAPLPLGAAARSAGGEHPLDLAPLGLAPGDLVTAWVEAADNDTITGPKRAESAPIAIRVADPRVKREQTREEITRLTDDLVELLGEQLDAEGRYDELARRADANEPFPWDKAGEAAARQQAARDAATRAEERAGRLADELYRDPATREETAFQADLIRQGLAELRERQLAPMQEAAAGLEPATATPEETQEKTGFMAATAAQAARKAEQLALMAEAMQRERGLAELADQGQDMGEAEERLLSGLERLSPGDRAAAQEVLRELDRIERDLRELAESLLKENKELPEEFLNADALRELDLKPVLDAVERVRQLLKAGDVAGAKQAARDLAKQLADLRNRLRQAAEEVDERQQQALDRLQAGTLPMITTLADRQRMLLERTEQLEGQAGPRLEEALRQLARARSAAAPPAEADVLTPEERGRADALAAEQRVLRETALRLAAEATALRAVLPFLPVEVAGNLEEAAAQMDGAAGLLARREPGQALPPERAALAALLRSRSKAASALDQLGQMQQMRQGPGGPQLGLGAGPTRPGQGSGSSDSSRGRRSGGRRGADVRAFAIPGRQEYRAPKLFREEILKSLRDGYPAQYEERIKDYYQRIAE